MNDVVITVRVPKTLKEKISEYGITVSEVVRKALEEEVERMRLEEAREASDGLGELFAKVPEEEIIKSIKESRLR